LCSSLTTLFMDGYRSPEVSGLFALNRPNRRKNDPDPQLMEALRPM
jgi:hypothetical protein